MRLDLGRRKTGFCQAPREFDVGGEIHIKGRTLLDLGIKLTGGAINHCNLIVGMSLFELDQEFVQRKFQISGGGDGDFFRLRKWRPGKQQH